MRNEQLFFRGRGNRSGQLVTPAPLATTDVQLPDWWADDERFSALDLATVRLGGSRAYGTHRPDSDYDYRGVYVAPTTDILGMDIKNKTQSLKRTEPDDVVVWEIGHFFNLARSCNPNALEVLWCPIIRESPAGELMTANRQTFLSKQVFQSYGGYARGQLRQAQAGTGGSRGQAHFRRQKFLLHLLRIMEQGIQLLETGDMDLQIRNPQRLKDQADAGLEVVQEEFERLDEQMNIALEQSPLPDDADKTKLNELLVQIRLSQLEVHNWQSTV